jgi:hypothetical protein
MPPDGVGELIRHCYLQRDGGAQFRCAHLMQNRFQPSVFYMLPLKRLGARLLSVNTRFDDHSSEE